MKALALVLLAAATSVASADPAKPNAAPAEAPKQPAKWRQNVELQPKGKPFKEIVVDNPLGDVRVEGYDGTSLLIETHKTAPDEEALQRLHVQAVPNLDGTVRMKTTVDPDKEGKPVARSSVRIDLLVKAPRDVRINAVSSSGTLEVWNMDGGSDLDTASGNISVHNVAGEISTHSVSGATSLTQVFGSIDAQTVSSDLDLDSINGEKLIATASHGRIAGRRVRSRMVELTTTDGRITLEAEASLDGHFIVSSLSGNVDVRIRRRGVLVVRARGARVEFDQATQQQAPQKSQPDGLVEAQFGQLAGNAPSALLELRSQRGFVTFGIIQ